MTGTEILDISKESLWVLFKVTGPLMLVSLVVGVLISFFQALTQIQEMTLTFVPKILSLFVVFLLLLPFIGQTFYTFTEHLFALMGRPGP